MDRNMTAILDGNQFLTFSDQSKFLQNNIQILVKRFQCLDNLHNILHHSRHLVTFAIQNKIIDQWAS